LPLRIRIDAIGLSVEEYKQSVFGPELFVLAYRYAIQVIVVNSSVERVLFKAFENSFMQGLDEVYQRLNEVLVEHGVLGDLDVTKRLKDSASASNKEKETTGVATEEPSLDAPASPSPNQRSAVNQSATNELPVLPTELPERPYGSPMSAQPLKTAHKGSVLKTSAPFQPSNLRDDQQQGDAFRANQETAQAAFGKVLGLVKSLK